MKKILMVGAGDLCLQIIKMLAYNESWDIYVGSRNIEKTIRLCNLVKLSFLHKNIVVNITPLKIDINKHSDTAECLSKLKPDVIVNCASIQSWRKITELPKNIFNDLDKAQLGPWLPMHLAPAFHLMSSVKQGNINPICVNTAYPDAVNPVLDKVGLSPDVGIGNVANLIPALKLSLSNLINENPKSVSVKLIAHHYFSHYVPRFGKPKQDDYILRLYHENIDITNSIDQEKLLSLVMTKYRRLGGLDGQYLTAASAYSVVNNLFSNDYVDVHAPGPNGLIGGYPIKVGKGEIKLSLPKDITDEAAVTVNKKCQIHDGITKITDDGTVFFDDECMDIMKNIIGYSCNNINIADIDECAFELSEKYSIFKNKINN